MTNSKLYYRFYRRLPALVLPSLSTSHLDVQCGHGSSRNNSSSGSLSISRHRTRQIGQQSRDLVENSRGEERSYRIRHEATHRLFSSFSVGHENAQRECHAPLDLWYVRHFLSIRSSQTYDRQPSVTAEFAVPNEFHSNRWSSGSNGNPIRFSLTSIALDSLTRFLRSRRFTCVRKLTL